MGSISQASSSPQFLPHSPGFKTTLSLVLQLEIRAFSLPALLHTFCDRFCSGTGDRTNKKARGFLPSTHTFQATVLLVRQKDSPPSFRCFPGFHCYCYFCCPVSTSIWGLPGDRTIWEKNNKKRDFPHSFCPEEAFLPTPQTRKTGLLLEFFLSMSTAQFQDSR